jgi:AraC family transcriptional regulator, transcriptional activator of pobA
MMKQVYSTELQFRSLYELYNHLGLPTHLVEPLDGFTIHNLKDSGFDLPYESPLFRPEYYSFLFIKDGRGKYTIDEYTFEVAPKTLYFTNPGNYRTFSWKCVKDILLITFDDNFLKKYISKDIFEQFPFLLTETISPKVLDDSFYDAVSYLFTTIYNEFRCGETDSAKIIGHLLAILLFKIKECFWKGYNAIDEGNRSSQIVNAFKRMLDKHYQNVSVGTVESLYRVKDYADAQSLNANYLSNVIKSKTGKPITTWIAEKTIAEAKRMLETSTLSIKEVSYRLGFLETAHFSNYFKRYTGIRPAEYKKQFLSLIL